MLGGNSRSRTYKRHLLGVVAGACASLAVLGGTAAPAAADIPDFRPEQWALTSIGAQEVWERTEGRGVTVAMPGASVDEEHPDLRDNVEIDTELGENGAANQQGTAAAALVVAHGHGMDADGGVLGVAPEASVLAIPTEGDLSKAVRHAVESGVQVILLPRAGDGSEALLEATAFAADRDTLVVGPAGGEEDPNVLAVAGVDQNGGLVPESPDASLIDLTAPGVELETAGPDMGQTQVDGAPYAAAITAGAAALLTAEYPQLDPAQLRDAMVEGSQEGSGGLPTLHVESAMARASGEAQDIPLIDENLVQEDQGVHIPLWMWFALIGLVLAIIVLGLVLWVRRSSADPYGVKAEREAEEEELALERAAQAREEERPSRRKKGGRRRKSK